MQPIIAALLAAAGPALEQALPQLLASPSFQSIIKSALDSILANISAGVHPTDATNQAMGKVGAAAVLHLSGNPLVDFAPLFQGLKPTTAPTSGKSFP